MGRDKPGQRLDVIYYSYVICLWTLADSCCHFHLSVPKALTLGLVAEFAADEKSETFQILNDLNSDLNNNASVILSILFLFNWLMDEFCKESSFKPLPLLGAACGKKNTHQASFCHGSFVPRDFILRNVLLWDFTSTFEVKKKNL